MRSRIDSTGVEFGYRSQLSAVGDESPGGFGKKAHQGKFD